MIASRAPFPSSASARCSPPVPASTAWARRSPPSSPPGSIAQLLQQAEQSKPQQALLLRLNAADQAAAARSGPGPAHSRRPAARHPGAGPADVRQHPERRAALARQKPKSALQALQHPSFARLGELPMTQQGAQPPGESRRPGARRPAPGSGARAHRPGQAARCPPQPGQPRDHMAAALRPVQRATRRHRRYRTRTGLVPEETAQADPQQRQPDARSPTSPSGRPPTRSTRRPLQLPLAVVQLQEIANRPLTHVALLLPSEGQLASVASALRDGFLAARLPERRPRRAEDQSARQQPAQQPRRLLSPGAQRRRRTGGRPAGEALGQPGSASRRNCLSRPWRSIQRRPPGKPAASGPVRPLPPRTRPGGVAGLGDGLRRAVAWCPVA